MSLAVRVPVLVALLASLSGCSVAAPSIDVDGSEPGRKATPAKPEAIRGRCGLGSGRDPVLVATRGDELLFIRGDGTHFVAATFPTHDGPGQPAWQIAIAGGYVAVAGYTWGGKWAEGHSVLLDRAGHVLFSSLPPKAVVTAVYVNASGEAVFVDPYLARSFVAHADGSSAEVDGAAAIGAPTSTGRFVAQRGGKNGLEPEFGWAGPGADFTPLAYAHKLTYPIAAGDEALYIGERDGEWVFVREKDGSATTFPIADDVYGVSSTSDGWAVMTGSNSGIWLAAPGAGPELVSLPNNEAPFGMDPFQGIAVGPTDGELLLAARDASRGGLFRSGDGGASWSRVGPTFAKIQNLDVANRGGTYMLAATDQSGYFFTAPWKAPETSADAPDHRGAGVFLVRPSQGITRSIQLDPGRSTGVVVSNDGLCAAFEKHGAIHTLDVEGGATGKLLDDNTALVVAWLE
jgi:hypothetical protein